MTLTQSYIDHQVKTLGVHTRDALARYNDPELTARTVLFDNLKQCGGINRKYDTSVIAQTMANILDARAWEDYLDVDGSRKSCPSFAEWLDRNGVDIKLAEFAIKEKKTEYLANFYEARDGKLLTREEVWLIAEARGREYFKHADRDKHGFVLPSSGDNSSPSGNSRKRASAQTASGFVRRLEREASTNSKVGEIYELVKSGEITAIRAAITLGWKEDTTSPEVRARTLFNKCFGSHKELKAQLGISPLQYLTYLHQYAQAHPEILEDLLNSDDTN